MNPTIEKIVNLLFEDLMETEETTAIHDEILTNCQERYQDMVDSGMSEDDAIAAVIESLNGMEEMLSDYPRKPADPAAEKQETEETGKCWSCDPVQSPIREIRMERMGNADVSVCVSQDDLLHVECFNPDLTLMTGMENSVVTITLKEQATEKEEIKFSLEDGFDLSSIGRIFGKLARRFTSNFGETKITLAIPAALCPEVHIGTASGDVTIEPMTLDGLRICTASGDVELDSLQIKNELRLTTASGDITVNDAEAQQLQLSSVSGDIEASSCRINESVRLNTTSGDISWHSQCKVLNANSISGDITVEGEAETITFRTVSGDAELTLSGSRLLAITGSTTSGDVGVCLPEGMNADVSCSTGVGDIYNHAGSIPGAPVAIKLSTVSGDIEIN